MQTMEYPTINLKATGERIAMLRREAGITVAELSRFMGFNEPQAVYKWQRGESLPTVDNLFALSRMLGTTIEDILVSDDEMSSRLLKNYRGMGTEISSGQMHRAVFFRKCLQTGRRILYSSYIGQTAPDQCAGGEEIIYGYGIQYS